MNLFTLEGRVLHIAPRSKSYLITVGVGIQRNTRDVMWSVVPKVLVRVPRRLVDQGAVERMKINGLYEMYGHLNPLLFRDTSNNRQHQIIEFILSGFEELTPTGKMNKRQTERSLYSRWEAKGILLDYIPNRQASNPDNAVIQIRRKVDDVPDRHIQGTDRVMVTVRTQMKERMAGVDIGDSVNVEGRIFGRLRRVPSPTPGDYEETLFNSLGLSRVRVSGVKPAWTTEESSYDRANLDTDEDAYEDEDAESYTGTKEDYEDEEEDLDETE